MISHYMHIQCRSYNFNYKSHSIHELSRDGEYRLSINCLEFTLISNNVLVNDISFNAFLICIVSYK